jgi:hypothetical protein
MIGTNAYNAYAKRTMIGTNQEGVFPTGLGSGNKGPNRTFCPPRWLRK